MKPKQLIILVAVLAAAGIIAFVVNSNRSGSSDDRSAKEGTKLLPDLPVNDIAQMKITGPKDSVHLARKDGTGNWTVVDREGYAADFTKLKRFVKDIADLEITQTQRVGASQLGRVGLAEPGGEEGDEEETGTRIELMDNSGNSLKTILMGKRYEAPAGEPGAMGGGSQGRYIKADDSGEVYVVSTVFWNLESDPPSWLDKESFAVQKHKSISVTHEKPEDSFTLFREEEGGDLKLKDAIEGKELDTGATGGIGGAFSSASFVDVLTGEAKAEDKTGLDKPVNVDIETFEDFKYAVRVGKKNDDSRYPLTFTVSADLPEKREVEDGVEETEEEKKSRDEAFEKEQTRLKEKLEKETALAGNVYLVESWAVERVLKKKDELYKKEEDKKGAANNNTGTTATTPPIQVPLRPPESTDGSKPKEKITATTPPISVKDAIEKAKKDAEKKAAEAAEKEGADASKDDPAKKLEEELKKAVEEKKDGADTTSEAKPDGDGGEAVKETEETTKESGE